MATVVILGASGYVAQRLIAVLLAHGHRTVAVARDPGRTPFYARTGAEVMTPAELAQLKSEAPVLINLSYPQNVPTLELQAENKRQISGWLDLAAAIAARRFIHISTQSVFGFVWKRQPGAGPAPPRFDDAYVELKLQAEHILHASWRKTPRFEFAIVRLGNVLGGGALPFVVNLAQRILEGRPATARNGEGVLNGTHGDNIAAYLRVLIEVDRLPEEPGVFHHLVEFGDRRWKELVEPMAEAIGVRPVYLTGIPGEPAVFSMRKLRPHVTTAVRRLGGVIRSIPGLAAAFEKMKPKQSLTPWTGSDPNRGWFVVTGGDIVFPPATIPGWTPPVSWDAAVADIVGWLGVAGYRLRPPEDLDRA